MPTDFALKSISGISTPSAVPRSARGALQRGLALQREANIGGGVAADESRIALGLAAILLATALLSVNNVALVYYYRAGGTAEIMLISRYVVFVLVAGIGLMLAGRSLWVTRAVLRRVTLSGLIYAVGMIALLSAMERMDVSLAILTLYTFPIILMLLEAAVDRTMPGRGMLMCVVAAFLGLGTALEVYGTAPSPEGVAFATLAAACFAVTFFWNARYLSDVGTGPVTFYMKLTGFPLILAYASFSLTDIEMPVSQTQIVPWVVSLAGYLTAFAAMMAAVVWAGPGRSARLMNLEPLMTLGLAALILGEEFSLPRIVGTLIVVGAIVVAQQLERRRID